MYRLLIVDDPESCDALLESLDWQHYGFRTVATAHSAPEGISLALDLRPHLMLLGAEAWGVAAYLREVGVDTLFAVLSADRDPEHILRAMRAGARDYLTKPLDAEELRSFVERVLVSELGGRAPRGEEALDPVLKVPYADLSKITNKIIMIVKSSYRQPQTLTAIAESMHMSGKYIGRIFLRDTGIKFSEYLMAYRMLEARKLIVGTQEKISVIAGDRKSVV